MSDKEEPKHPNKKVTPLNADAAKALQFLNEANVEVWKAHMEKAIEVQTFLARYVGARFKALLNEGFTRAEALELCKRM